MSKVVALLRSVNVGGNRMRMDFLREVARDAGCEDVATVLATGNVVMAPPVDPAATGRALEDLLAERYGSLAVIMRSHDDLVGALASNPWSEAVAAGDVPGNMVHTMFLADAPGQDAVDRARADQPDGPEHFVVVGRHLHAHYPDGMGRSTLTGTWLERRLGTGTMRNHNTVRKLVEASR